MKKRAKAIVAVCAVFGCAARALAVTYYISPSGSDSAGSGSASSPWRTANHAFQVGGGGNTYIFKDGNYNYAGSNIDNPPSGSAGAPTVVKAENDGSAVIDGAGARPGISISQRQYITIEGFYVQNCGEQSAVQVTSPDGAAVDNQTNNITIRRVGARGSAQSSNNNVIEMARARDCLLEDVWGWGYGRYVLDVYGCTRVTVRRAVLRWDGWGSGADKPGDPKFDLGVYDTHDSLFENLLLLDAASTALGGDKGGLYLPGNSNGNTAPYDDSDNNTFLGLVILANSGIGMAVEGGSGGTNDNNRFENLVIWGNSGHGVSVPHRAVNTVFNHVTIGGNGVGTYFSGALNSVSGTQLTNSLVVGNAGNGVDGSVTLSHNNVVNNGTNYSGVSAGANSISQNPLQKYILQIENGAPGAGRASDGGDMGATVVQRYQGGTLSSQDLWPWPNQSRLKAEMCAEVSRGFCASGGLTEYVWKYLGNSNPYPGETTDTTRPSVISVNAISATTVLVQYSEPVERASAESETSYGVNNIVTVSRALLGPDMRTVTLTVSPLTSGLPYLLTVTGVRDQAASPNSILPGTARTFTYSSGSSAGANGVDDPLKPLQKVFSIGASNGGQVVFGSQAVEVVVHDSSGNAIFSRSKEVGQTLTWDARDSGGRIVRAGVYMCKIRGADGKTVYYPLVIVK